MATVFVRGPIKLPFQLPGSAAGVLALGRLPSGCMNRTEQAYDAHLQQLQLVGDVLWHQFEAIKFKLGAGTYCTPDFLVLLPSRELECAEEKGVDWRWAHQAAVGGGGVPDVSLGGGEGAQRWQRLGARGAVMPVMHFQAPKSAANIFTDRPETKCRLREGSTAPMLTARS